MSRIYSETRLNQEMRPTGQAALRRTSYGPSPVTEFLLDFGSTTNNCIPLQCYGYRWLPWSEQHTAKRFQSWMVPTIRRSMTSRIMNRSLADVFFWSTKPC